MAVWLAASKTAIFTAGVACITVGSNLLESNLLGAVILIILGIVLIILYTYLIEKQSAEKALKLTADFLSKSRRKVSRRDG